MSRGRTHRGRKSRPARPVGLVLATGVLAGVTLLALGLPGSWAIAQCLRSHPDQATTTARAFTLDAGLCTLAYASAIGLLATILAWPAASVLRSTRKSGVVWAALAGVPLLMPTYLAYSGWGQVRAPRTWFGDVLARSPPEVSLVFDKSLAVWGLALWAWPLAALVLAAGLRRIPRSQFESLRLDRAGVLVRAGCVLRWCWGSVVLAVTLVALIMAGSAVPLHLAQVQTSAIQLWAFMSLSTDTRAIWVGSLPLWAGALVGAWAMVRAGGRIAPGMDVVEDPVEPGSGSRVGFLLVWGASVLVPLGLFAWSLRSWSSIGEFWVLSGAAVGVSLKVGVVVGALGAVIAVSVWFLASSRVWDRRRLGGMGVWGGWVRGMGVVLVAGGLGPGILVGAGTRGVWNGWVERWLEGLGGGEAWADSLLPVVLAHTARWMGVAVMVGLAMARLETREERARRDLDGADSGAGWVRACLRPAWRVPLGVALACGALSVHEIESTIQVQPPGPSSLAQQLLDALHYSKDEQLSAAAINLLVVGTGVALGASWLVVGGLRRTRVRE